MRFHRDGGHVNILIDSKRVAPTVGVVVEVAGVMAVVIYISKAQWRVTVLW